MSFQTRFLGIFSLVLISLGIFLAFAPHVSAHEQYVLTQQQLDSDYAVAGVNVWSSLQKPENLKIGLEVGAGVLAVFLLYFFLVVRTSVQTWLDRKLEKVDWVGYALIRVAVGASFIYSAATNVFLGPEIPLSSLPWGSVIHYALYVVGALMIVGAFSEIAGAAALAILFLATWVYREYMLTYFNYFGEFLGLLLFGSRIGSLDRIFFGLKAKVMKYAKDWEILLLRVTYGISVLYPAITLKLFHPEVIVDIVNRYHLTQFHWLFPGDPLFVSLGAGLAQIFVAVLIIIGLETRLASFATFVLYVLSVLFFKETVWPHYILLALSFYFVLNGGGGFTVDRFIARRRQRN